MSILNGPIAIQEICPYPSTRKESFHHLQQVPPKEKRRMYLCLITDNVNTDIIIIPI